MGTSEEILLVAKKSFYQLYGLEQKEPRFLRMMEQNRALADSLLAAHDENLRAVDAVEEFLSRRGVDYSRGEISGTGDEKGYRLLISVGGDGTLLHASRWLRETPIVGVNSRPNSSVGYFCMADTTNFRRRLEAVLRGDSRWRELSRCSIFINGKEATPPALNEFLYAATNPAASTIYSIKMDGQEEYQKSSGIWVATPAGSSAAIHSAGGTKMPLGSRMLQFMVREIYLGKAPAFRLLRGTFSGGLKIINLTLDASVYVDGGMIHHTLCYGDEIEPRLSAHPLKIHL